MKFPTALAVLTGLATMLCSFGVAPAEAAFPGAKGMLVYSTNNLALINVLSPDGSGGGIPSPPGRSGHARWSADGRKIVYASNASGSWQIYSMAANGTYRTRLSTVAGYGNGEPAWSPDGTRIAFVSNRSGSFGIHVMNADGSGVGALTTEGREPAWSPDGSRIAFVSRRQWGGKLVTGIFTINTDGTGVALVSAGAEVHRPDWSPDGRLLLFTRQAGLGREIVAVRADPTARNESGRLPTTPFVIARGRATLTSAAWSPDGAKVVFGDRGPPFPGCFLDCPSKPEIQLFVVNANGANRTRLGIRGHDPDWQPVR